MDTKQLVNVIKLANPTAGLVADLALMVLDASLPEGESDEIKGLREWLEARTVKLLERLADKNTSSVYAQELEIRLHETLDILMGMKKEKPWDG